MAKQTTITIETRSLVIVQVGRSDRAWCPWCSAEAQMIAVEDTRSIPAAAATAIRQWLDAGDVHCCSGSEGSTLICLNSLLARIRTDKEST